MKGLRDPKTGQYLKNGIPWDFSRWDEGFIDRKGRFRIYRPDYVNGSQMHSYFLRSHIVWWLVHEQVVPDGFCIHHKNQNPLDDRIENLELKPFGQHTRDHCKLPDVLLVCEHCKQEFYISREKFNSRIREGHPIRFCSQKCFHATPCSQEKRDRLSNSLKLAYSEGRKKPRQPTGKWSRKHDACTKCGSAERRHASRGLCFRCYNPFHRGRNQKIST